MKYLVTLVLWSLVLVPSIVQAPESKQLLNQQPLNQQPDPIYKLIDKLANCESNNNPLVVNWEDNGSPSYGLLQFKERTFIHYTKRYNLMPKAEDNEILNNLFDGNYQRELAYRMLKEKAKNSVHWYNCSKQNHS